MKASKLALALAAGIALPLGAMAATGDRYDQQSTQSGSQYGSSNTGQTGSDMSRSGTSDMNRQSGSTQSNMGRGSTDQSDMRAGAQGSAGLPMFDALDKNTDGFISKAEAKKSATVNKNFSTYDTDHDGKISRDEWQAAGGQMSNQ